MDPKFKTQIQVYLERSEARKQAHSAGPSSQRGIGGGRVDDLNRENEAAAQQIIGDRGRPMAQDVIFGQRGVEQAGVDGHGVPPIVYKSSGEFGEQSAFNVVGQAIEPREMVHE